MKHKTALDNLANAEKVASKASKPKSELRGYITIIAVGGMIGLAIGGIKHLTKDSPEEILYQQTNSRVYNECMRSKEMKLAAEIQLYQMGMERTDFKRHYIMSTYCESKGKEEAEKVSGIKVK